MPTTLEIYTDTVPVQGKITILDVPQRVAANWPVSLSATKTATFETKNIRVTDQGTLIDTSGQNFVELTYYAGEKPKLEGWFYYSDAKGTMSVTRK